MSINNEIGLREDWVPVLDEAYRLGSLTAVLDADPELVNLRAGRFRLPIMELDGLADHNRANGGQYVAGNTNLTWKEYEPTYTRNRKFGVDARDDYETAGVAFGMLAGQFIREHVIPENDAWRMASYYKQAGTQVDETIADATALTKAITKAITILEENEVPQGDVHLFTTPTLLNQTMLLNTYESIKALAHFEDRIVKIPQRRFQTDIKLLDGVTAGETKGGYEATVTSKDINFAIISKGSIIQGLSHVAPKYIASSVNQNADGDEFAYRVDGIELVKENRKIGLYFSVAE